LTEWDFMQWHKLHPCLTILRAGELTDWEREFLKKIKPGFLSVKQLRIFIKINNKYLKPKL